MSEFRRKLMMMYAHKRSNDILYPGLIAAWSAKGKTNDDADRAVLRDLTGNGHDITLNNFAFTKNSGYGGISLKDFNIGTIAYKVNAYTTYTETRNGGAIIHGEHDRLGKFKIKVTGLQNGDRLEYGQGEIQPTDKSIYSDGVYSFTDEGIVSTGNLGFKLYGSISVKTKVYLELIPEYPDALVFDGVDDYGANNNITLIDDFTLILKTIPLNFDTESDKTIISNDAGDYRNCAFSIRDRTYLSYGRISGIKYPINYPIIYATPTNYNGISVEKGTGNDTNVINLARLRNNEYYSQMVFYSAYLFDRSLDEQEIKAFIRKYIDEDYLLPSEIPNPDCYYDFTNGDNTSETRDTITDLSGNGNDAVAHNFAWNEEGSGYKDGALVFDGVDDYVTLDAFDSGFKTMFMVCNYYLTGKILYDQRSDFNTKNDYAIFPVSNQSSDVRIAYGARNINSTYINGILNNNVECENLLSKKHLITVKSNLTQSNTPKIAVNFSKDGYFANMELYKFLGFKERLTDEQIQYVIKKYNLLDGVDEIEVS